MTRYSPVKMNINCHHYRKSMELLSLRKRLEKGIPDPKEQEEVEKKITVLEKELKLD